jgi:pimeloyl-ACP methyl ester carboxylesterase
MASEERDVQVDGVTLRVREAGVADGEPVIHFHGTPGSRLELTWADEVVSAAGVRMIAFDRPGYGASTGAPFSLGSVARMTLQVADQMGLEQFRTTGWSGGGPFALAIAATAPERVPAVGVIAGAGPFQLIPGALEELSEGDKAAERLLPGNPEGAAAGFADGFDMSDGLASAEALYEMFEPLLCEWDRTQWNGPGRRQALFADMREALKSGVWGCAWDNVAWIGAWDVDPSTVRCPVLLWYGSEDLMATPKHARWLDENLPNARLAMWEGEGHLLAFTHLAEMLRELLTCHSGLWWRAECRSRKPLVPRQFHRRF